MKADRKLAVALNKLAIAKRYLKEAETALRQLAKTPKESQK